MKKSAMAVLLACVSAVAYAESSGAPVAAGQKWKEECGSCHLAYPPRLLTAENWRSLMAGLDRHFGTNAGMDQTDSKDIQGYLERQAGRGDRHSAATLRISDTPWFRHEHRKVPARAWTDSQVKSASNCTGCHINAARGNWSEEEVRMPGGWRMRDDD